MLKSSVIANDGSTCRDNFRPSAPAKNKRRLPGDGGAKKLSKKTYWTSLST
jgi:hypothetical protein